MDKWAVENFSVVAYPSWTNAFSIILQDSLLSSLATSLFLLLINIFPHCISAMILDVSYVVRRLSALFSLLGYWLLQNIGLADVHAIILPFKVCAIYYFSSIGGLSTSMFLGFFSPKCRSFLDYVPSKVLRLNLSRGNYFSDKDPQWKRHKINICFSNRFWMHQGVFLYWK